MCASVRFRARHARKAYENAHSGPDYPIARACAAARVNKIYGGTA
jgi:hypothetical protein